MNIQSILDELTSAEVEALLDTYEIVLKCGCVPVADLAQGTMLHVVAGNRQYICTILSEGFGRVIAYENDGEELSIVAFEEEQVLPESFCLNDEILVDNDDTEYAVAIVITSIGIIKLAMPVPNNGEWRIH